MRNETASVQKKISDETASIVYDIAYHAGFLNGKSYLTDITHRNYEATKRRGLITGDTHRFDFGRKLKEELNEFKYTGYEDWSELSDITLVCFAMAEHYGIDLIEEMRKKTEFNETRR